MNRFFDWMDANPSRHEVFDRAMSAGGHLHGYACGGGAGLVVITPGVRCRRWERRHPAGAARAAPAPRGCAPRPAVVVVERAPAHERLRVQAGDAFVELPDGCETPTCSSTSSTIGGRRAVPLRRPWRGGRRQPTPGSRRGGRDRATPTTAGPLRHPVGRPHAGGGPRAVASARAPRSPGSPARAGWRVTGAPAWRRATWPTSSSVMAATIVSGPT